MKLTALEIKQQKFEKVFRGIDPAEVQSFLTVVSNEWEHLCTKNRELGQQIEELQKKIKHYERVEEALHETLQAAKETSDTKVAGAQKEAAHTLEKANLEAVFIVKAAEVDREKVLQGIHRLIDRRKEIVAGLRSYLNVALESVEQFGRDSEENNKQPEEDKSTNKPAEKKSSPPKKFMLETTKSTPESDTIDDLVDDLD